MITHRVSQTLVLSFLVFLAAPATAQPPVPPPPPNPQAPTIAPLPSMGMQRGTKLELVLTGTNLADPSPARKLLPPLCRLQKCHMSQKLLMVPGPYL